MTSSADLDSQEEKFLIDFLYADRPRLATLSAQLFSDGHLLSSKTQSIHGSESAHKIAGSLKVVSGDTSSVDKLQESIERQFDATWATPLNVISELGNRGFIGASIAEAKLGQVVAIQGSLQISDLRMVQKLWKPVLKAQGLQSIAGAKGIQKQLAIQSNKENLQLAEIVELLPHVIQMRIFSEEQSCWATIDPSNLVVNSEDLTYKHGALIPGVWTILALVDAPPSNRELDLIEAATRIQHPIEQMMLGLLKTMRELLGRGEEDYGVTPLAIYRTVK